MARNEERVPPTLDALNPVRLRRFLIYVRDARPSGRYGILQGNTQRQTRPSTVATFYSNMRAFANFAMAEAWLEENPLQNVKPPRIPSDQIRPLIREQIQALLDATGRSRAPERDRMILFLGLDTGMRAQEMCDLNIGDVERVSGTITVAGKGGKRRFVYLASFGRRALWRYLEAERRDAAADEPLLISVGGRESGGRMTPNGLTQIIERLGKAADITGVRCSAHTLRHTMAIHYLRNGGNVLELARLLGHESLEMTKRYVAYAETDLAQAHRAASPMDRMKLK